MVRESHWPRRFVFVGMVSLGIMFDVAQCQEPPSQGDIVLHPWSYRAELPGTRPVARTIVLQADRPEDLVEEPSYSGTRQRYAQIRYGSENSRRVILVVDDRGGDEFDLYMDLDRDRGIASTEKVDGVGRERQIELAAEILDGVIPLKYPRQVSIRMGATGDRLSIATLGGMAGMVSIKSAPSGLIESVSAQRIDGDANGLFADARDRLRVDLNGDNKFDAIDEQFAWLPVLTLANRRYAVRADRQGETLSLHEIVGTGQLQISLARLPSTARVLAFEAMVFSDDASAWSLKEANQPQEVPVGKYALGSVTLTIDNGDAQPWHFVFTRSGPIEAKDWTDVGAKSSITLEAIGDLSLVLECGKEQVRPGEQLSVSPRLYTQGGLLVNLSSRGRLIGSFDDARFYNACEIRLVDSKGDTLSSARSGFA